MQLPVTSIFYAPGITVEHTHIHNQSIIRSIDLSWISRKIFTIYLWKIIHGLFPFEEVTA